MIENLFEISKEQLLGETQSLFFDNYRFVTVTCVDNGDETLTLTYHYDRDFQLKNLRFTVARGEEVPSISRIYFCAVLVENEIKELFGVNVQGLVIDYGGHLLLSDDDLENPMARRQITIEKKGAN